jgi:plasmid stabilization system protein ParE
MIHKVRLTQETYDQIAAISDHIAQDSPGNARRWRLAIHEHLRSLRRFPEGHEIAYSADDVGHDVRHTFFGVYRILYTVKGHEIAVITVRHGARRPLTPDEVRRLV